MKCTALIFYGLLVAVQGRTIDINNAYMPRIINGENVQLGERPYQVALLLNGKLWCGGSILNEFWIVTASHCVDNQSMSSFLISAGTINIREPYSLHKVQQIIMHEDFISGITSPNDIALIKLANPLKFSYRIQPAQLPKPHVNVRTSSSAIVSGWGNTERNPAPKILQKARVYITDQKSCQTIMEQKNYNILPTQICAKDPTTRRGECHGDSGGPITVNDVLIGIQSWSIKDPICGSSHFPGIHTRVSEFIDWINRHI